jgi:HAD superfamily hydrolase (TIGR01509 family)
MTRPLAGSVAAVVFDMDGLLIDTEPIWEAARERIAREGGGSWRADSQTQMMGMSTPEWTGWMHAELGVRMSPDEIRDAVLERIERGYRERVPLMPGARSAVERMAARWPLGVASSSPRRLLEVVLAETGLGRLIEAFVSSEEVARGKPAPDVWLEAARRLEADPGECVAVEDSPAGIRSAHAAGLAVIVVPDPKFPPAGDALTLAAGRLDSLEQLSVDVIERARAQSVT